MAALPLLLGHRGTRAVKAARENTLPSFDLALEHGCDGFEFDLRLTADGEAVVCHDATVNNLHVCQASRDLLPDCPELKDVLEHCGKRAFLNIEIKVTGMEGVVLSAIRECRPQREFVVSSFLPEVLMELKARSGGVPVGLICDSAGQLAHWRQLPLEYVIVERRLASQDLIREVQHGNRRMFVWTVNDPTSMQQFADWGVDGIISDETQLLVKTLRPAKAMGSQK